ncbi:MAG: ABC transporter permease [Actinobacteria bacterium]|nr:ABC transporter permease [Actinomycetota bacterium]
MWAMVVKEFRQLRRDRRTLAMMIVLPLLLLVVFGYAASFDVSEIPTVVVGPAADDVADRLPAVFSVEMVLPESGRAEAEGMLRDGDAAVAVVADPSSQAVLLDGSELFSARAALQALAGTGGAGPAGPSPGGALAGPEVLFNPELRTSAVMVPALVGMILLFVGTVITSLGVVRERQAGTLEQLAVMPLSPRDVFVGKIAPYFLVAAVDMAVIVTAGTLLFDVPFRGSLLTLFLGAVLFLFVTLGIGVLISTVSQNQGQAVQLAIMTLLPQFLLSGLIFPVDSMAAGVRWIAYLLPLTYFNRIARGVMLRGTSAAGLAEPLLLLAALGAVVFGLAVVRFRHDLAPGGGGGGEVRTVETVAAGP